MHLLNLENFSAYLLPLLLVLALSFAIDSLKHRLGGILAPKPAILHSAPAIEVSFNHRPKLRILNASLSPSGWPSSHFEVGWIHALVGIVEA